MTIVNSIAEAVEAAGHVQESAPENLDIKRGVLEEIDRHAPLDTVVASSTSGIKPTYLQATLAHPERLVVGHPFQPCLSVAGWWRYAAVNRLVSGRLLRPWKLIRRSPMKPLHVRVEIDAFIADRLLEAVWREALWLVNDGVATTEEIDDAIRYGFGLRWAQMGLFETYRAAGGEGGVEALHPPVRPNVEFAMEQVDRCPRTQR